MACKICTREKGGVWRRVCLRDSKSQLRLHARVVNLVLGTIFSTAVVLWETPPPPRKKKFPATPPTTQNQKKTGMPASRLCPKLPCGRGQRKIQWAWGVFQQKEPKSARTFHNIFAFFFCSGEAKGESDAPGRGMRLGFLLKIPEGGGVTQWNPKYGSQGLQLQPALLS